MRTTVYEALSPIRSAVTSAVNPFLPLFCSRKEREHSHQGCVFVLLACSCLPSLLFAQSTDINLKLKLSTSNLPPLVNADGTGYLDSILSEVSERTNIRFDVRKMPAARGLALANAGKLDGDVARTDTWDDLYPNLIKVPEPLIDITVAGLYLQPGIRVDTLADFGKYRVGYVRGWKFLDSLFQHDLNVSVTRSVGQLLDMLAADRIDIIVMGIVPARQLARERGMSTMQITSYKARKSMYLYLHESRADINMLIDSAIRSMKEDGSYEAIVADYQSESQ